MLLLTFFVRLKELYSCYSAVTSLSSPQLYCREGEECEECESCSYFVLLLMLLLTFLVQLKELYSCDSAVLSMVVLQRG